MKAQYIDSMIASFCQEIEQMPIEAQVKKITSIYHTLFEIGKTDIAAFIDGFLLFSAQYSLPISYKEEYIIDILPENLRYFKTQYRYLEDKFDYCQKYNQILDVIWHSNHRSQNLILRNMFDSYYMPPIVCKHIIEHLQKEPLWGEHSLSQGLYFAAIDELLDFWLIEPAELVNFQEIVDMDCEITQKSNHYNLAVYTLAILLSRYKNFTKEENHYFKRSVISLFNKLQQRFPNCYVSYAHQTEINLLRYMYLNTRFMELYFTEFFSSFVYDFIHNHDDLAQLEVNKFLSMFIHVNSFPYNSVVSDKVSFVKKFQQEDGFIRLAKALELKNYSLDKYSFLALSYKELEYQELLIKSYDKTLYTYFFNHRLQYQLSKRSLCFDTQHEKENTGVRKI